MALVHPRTHSFFALQLFRWKLTEICLHSLLSLVSTLIFDGNTIYSRSPLPENRKLHATVHQRKYTLETKDCRLIDSDGPDRIQLANIILRRVLESLGQTRIFDKHFDLSKPLDLGLNGVDIYAGVASEISLRSLGSVFGMYLSLDPLHKVVSRTSILDEIIKLGAQADHVLKGLRVITPHNWSAYGVEGIARKLNPRSTFTITNRKTGEETETSYVDYYKEQGIVIRNLDQPLLISTGRMRARIYLVPELCVPAAIPGSAKARLPQTTSLKPTKRAERVQDLARLVTAASKIKTAQTLAQFGLTVTPTEVQVNSLQLASPKLVFAPNSVKTPQAEWRKEAANVKWDSTLPKRKISPLIIYQAGIDTEQFKPMSYWKSIEDKLKAMNAPLELQKAKAFPYKNLGAHASLQPTLEAGLKQFPAGTEVLMIVFLNGGVEHYNAYRTLTLRRGIIGQALDVSPNSIEKKMDPKNKDSIIGNLARQIVNKFSVPSWWYNIPDILPKHANKVFLTIGMDVFHAPAKLVQHNDAEKTFYWQKRSIVAYTAKFCPIGKSTPLVYCDVETRDAGAEIAGQRTMSSVPSYEATSSGVEAGAAHYRAKGSEASSSTDPSHMEHRGPNAGPLAKFLHECLTIWKSYIKDPSNLVIIVYRDGVADSQMDQVDAAEVAQLKEVSPPNAHLIYSVVQKRVHNRFIMSNAGQYGNCAPGTVVEDLARESGGRYNFFMVPCLTNLSTNKPVHYTITYDSHPNALTKGEFHAISYASHHTYQNWAGTVKVPDVCQYAHTLAYTLGECGIDDPIVPANLKPSMFFL